jgi:hypothetical protein
VPNRTRSKKTSQQSGHTLEDIVGQIEKACRNADGNGRVSVELVMQTLGPRSFGPLLMVPGLIGASPIGAIPGLPGVMAFIVFLVSAQILIGMDHAWLPGFLLRRSISAEKLEKGCEKLAKIARFVDRFVWPRFSFFTRGPFFYLIALLCLLVAVVTPIIELVPLAGIVPNAAIAAFGLSLTAHDGVWAIIATLFTVGSFYLLLQAF